MVAVARLRGMPKQKSGLQAPSPVCAGLPHTNRNTASLGRGLLQHCTVPFYSAFCTRLLAPEAQRICGETCIRRRRCANYLNCYFLLFYSSPSTCPLKSAQSTIDLLSLLPAAHIATGLGHPARPQASRLSRGPATFPVSGHTKRQFWCRNGALASRATTPRPLSVPPC